MSELTPTCYLLHFDRPYRHARRYLGSTNDCLGDSHATEAEPAHASST
jgi:hypothetical protein